MEDFGLKICSSAVLGLSAAASGVAAWAVQAYSDAWAAMDAHPLRTLLIAIVLVFLLSRFVLRVLPVRRARARMPAHGRARRKWILSVQRGREAVVFSEINLLESVPRPFQRVKDTSLRTRVRLSDVAHLSEHIAARTRAAPGAHSNADVEVDGIACYCPATLTRLGEVRVTPPEEVVAIVARARDVQRSWARVSLDERARVLRRLSDAILAQADTIVRLSCVDTGKPRVDAMFGEIASTLGKLDYVIRQGASVLRPSARASSFTTLHKRCYVTYEPFGVLGVIAPWNYPFYNMYNHIASGLFAGNAVVIKMSEYAAWSASAYVRIARDVLGACGYESDLVQLVQGFGETGNALVKSVDKVIFTGSPGIGRAVMSGASATLTPLVLELGGKDPFIVCEDADLTAVVAYGTRGSFQNSGQNCVGVERIYVYASIYDAFISRAAEVVAQMRVGAPVDLATGEFQSVDMGPITTAPQLKLIEELIEDAVSKGARVLVGGRARFAGDASDPLSNGIFFEPTLLVDVTHAMRIANEEVFGPVMTVFKVEGDSDDVAVAMANSTAYGLGATVFSGSPSRANAIAARLRCGMVGVNAYGLNYINQDLPFGGVGASGFDRFSGPEGLRSCCITKAIVADLLPWLSFPTPVPPPLLYPVSAAGAAVSWSLIQVQYASTWPARMLGMLGMILNNSRTPGPVARDARLPSVGGITAKAAPAANGHAHENGDRQHGTPNRSSAARRRPSNR